MTIASTGLLDAIASGTARLDPQRRVQATGSRGGSMPASRRSIANDDVLVLTDRRTGVVAVLNRWAEKIRQGLPLPLQPRQIVSTRGRLWMALPPVTIETELAVLDEHWQWAVQQPWGEKMVSDLEALRDAILSATGMTVRLIECPVCGMPSRIDEFVANHRDCLSQDKINEA
jgi:hypothetical protein